MEWHRGAPLSVRLTVTNPTILTSIALAAYLQVPELRELIREFADADPEGYKIIVFFTTARLTQFYAQLFNLMVSSAFSRLSVLLYSSCAAWIPVSDGRGTSRNFLKHDNLFEHGSLFRICS